jgi:hypothetical protein
MVSGDKNYVVRRNGHRFSVMVRWCHGHGWRSVVQCPICHDVASSDECLRLYDIGTEFTMPEGFGKGQLTCESGETVIPGIDGVEPAWAATARLMERDLAGRAPASHAVPGLEAVMAIAAVESLLRCGGESGPEVGRRGAVT